MLRPQPTSAHAAMTRGGRVPAAGLRLVGCRFRSGDTPQALPVRGDVSLEARDEGRAMRLSWHHEGVPPAANPRHGAGRRPEAAQRTGEEAAAGV